MVLKIRTGIILISLLTACSATQQHSNNQEWKRYYLDGLGLSVTLPVRLEPICGESFCLFSSFEGEALEGIEIKRYYINYEHDSKFYADSNSEYKYYEFKKDSIVIHVAKEKSSKKKHKHRSSAYFQTANYEFQMQYMGTDSELFDTFLKSLKIDHEKLKEQFEKNRREPDYTKLNLKLEIDLKGKNYLINHQKNECKIIAPSVDSISLSIGCRGCLLQNSRGTRSLEDSNWIIIPATNEDSIKIVLSTSLPENRFYRFDEISIPVKKE